MSAPVTCLRCYSGSLDPTERDELLALRRYRSGIVDGLVSLRAELVQFRGLGAAHDTTLCVVPSMAIEAVDALLLLPNGATP